MLTFILMQKYHRLLLSILFVTIDKNVEIGEGTWIGSNVTIMEGVRIGKNCKIFPGAVIGQFLRI